ncbi:LysR family transcriptional regulator [Bauldia sp.]|uniref:LysR family transcriptional regulator n=1 Tax=Bauldia sp. TaxID=2575872 RepID=UPI003BADB756
MNWQAIAFNWNQVRAFLVTAEEGSLSAASRALGLTQPTLGRQVAALEADLGVVLFERVGRSLTLTPSGLELLDHVRAMGEAASRISLTASGQSQTVEGRVLITAADVMSAYLLPPAVKRLRDIAPLLEIDIVAANEIRDLQRREADIAIRHVRPEQPDLIARLVRDAKGRFYAASSYLDRRGRPKTRAELAQHDFISFGDPDRVLEYLEPFGLGLTRANFRLGSKSGVVAWEMAKSGLGIVTMSDEVGEMTPGVEAVQVDLDPFLFPIWLTTHRELHTSRRIRLVFDLLADFLSKPQGAGSAAGYG